MRELSENLIREITSRLVAEFRPSAIYLFGSHAWGTPTEGSDIDLLIVVHDSDEQPPKRATRALRCLRDLDLTKDILVRTEAEVETHRNSRSSLTTMILEHGRKLYGELYA